MGISRWLANCEQGANLAEQVVADPDYDSLPRVTQATCTLPRGFIAKKVLVLLRKSDRVTIGWDSVSTVQKNAAGLTNDLDVMLTVEVRRSAGVEEDALRICLKSNICRAKQDFVMSIAAVKFPRRFEELEELSHYPLVRNICNDPDHVRETQPSAATGSSCPRSHSSRTTKLNKILWWSSRPEACRSKSLRTAAGRR